eukprot:2434022-Lingulodinium_polyedra.AAC.1
MVTMVHERVRKHQIHSLVAPGDIVVEFVQRLQDNMDQLTQGCHCYQLDVASSEAAFGASARP